MRGLVASTGRELGVQSTAGRAFEIVRSVAIGGLASALAGVVVLGVGGRLIMLASRLLHPEAIGRTTENGNRIGEFTVGGSLDLILFGGLLGGLVAAPVWVLVRQWISHNPLVTGLGAVAVGGFNLVDADNVDFLLLRPAAPDLLMLLLLVFVFGAAVPLVDRNLTRRLPDGTGLTSRGVYAVVTALGLVFVVPGLGQFTEFFCTCRRPPVATGILTWVVGGVTVWWWWRRVRSNASQPSSRVRIFGSTAVGLAAIAGSVHLVSEILRIL